MCLAFVSLISMCLDLFLVRFILYGTVCSSWTWLTISFSILGKFSTMSSSKIFSYPFFFSSSSGTPIIQMLVHLILSQGSLRLPSILFILFTLFCSSEVISYILSSSSWFILLLQMFCYWFLLEYFNFINCVVCLFMFIF